MLELLREYDMPVFVAPAGDSNVRILLDTGANLSVFNGSEEALYAFFEGAVRTEYITAINGFGGRTHTMRVFRLESLLIDKITIRNLLLVCQPFDMDVDLILAGTLLRINPFTIRLKDKRLEIEDIGRDIYCVPVRVEETGTDDKTIHSTTVFLEE